MKTVLYTKTNQMLIDAFLTAAAWTLAYTIRFEGIIPAVAYRQMLFLLIPVALGQIAMNAAFGIYKFQWRYVNTEDALCIARAYLGYWGLLFTISLITESTAPVRHVPFGIIVTAGFLSLGGALSARLARRVLYERRPRPASLSRPQKFLIIGAGAHGAMVAREMLLRSGIDLIGFLDDDPGKQNAVIAGRSVLGKVSDLAQIVESRDVDEVLVCIPPQSRPALHLSDAKTSKGVPVRSRIMPTLEEILQSTDVISIFPGLNEPPGTDGHTGSILRSDESDERIAVREVGAISAVSGNGNGHGNGNGNGGPRTQLAVTPIHVRTTESPAAPVRNKSILITGGAGFIGSSLAERLADYNRVLLFDQSFDFGPIQYTSLLQHPNVSVIQGSVLDSDLRSLVQDVDIIVHAAAILGVNRVCSAGRETLETNYVGTSRLLKALDASPNIQRFVYFSTSEVFGVNSYRVDEASRPSIGPIAESRWSYAMSKLAGEHLVASYYRETRLPIAIVRPFNIFGPRRTGDYALRRFILNALDGKPLEIHGDGTQIRSWCYIEDFCNALLQMMVRSEAIGEDFNIGHPGNTLTIYELAQKVIQLTGSTSPVTFCPSPFPDISIRVPSLEKARRLLAYEPRFDLNTGLKHTIEWYRENFMAFQPGSRSTVTSSATFLGQESAA
jgi:dTDP-glucose 4,6-dehydratase